MPTSRRELGFLTASALAIVVLAQLTDPGSPAEVVLLLPAVAAFVLRGLVPTLPAELFAALVLVPVALATSGHGELEGAFFLGVLVTLYTSWHLGSVTRAALIAAVSAALPLLVDVWLAPDAGFNWMAWTTANVFTFSLGRLLARQDRLIAQLEAAREALAEQAVAEERRRIARELHDLAGHTLAAMVLHVTGARHVLRRDIDEADRALGDAADVGRTGLDQIRATVAALRTYERGTDPSLAGSADLAALVDEYRSAGLVVDAHLAAGVAALEGPTGTALHRIAREALANVARHAPANAVELRVDVVDGEARLRVVDHGLAAMGVEPGVGHFGLVGMGERARALGGQFEAGPTPDGWRVDARLPVPTADGPAPKGMVG